VHDRCIALGLSALHLLDRIEEVLTDHFEVLCLDIRVGDVKLGYHLCSRDRSFWVDDFHDERSAFSKHSHIDVFSSCRMQIGNVVSWHEHFFDPTFSNYFLNRADHFLFAIFNVPWGLTDSSASFIVPTVDQDRLMRARGFQKLTQVCLADFMREDLEVIKENARNNLNFLEHLLN
jgi:hypothetical protein